MHKVSLPRPGQPCTVSHDQTGQPSVIWNPWTYYCRNSSSGKFVLYKFYLLENGVKGLIKIFCDSPISVSVINGLLQPTTCSRQPDAKKPKLTQTSPFKKTSIHNPTDCEEKEK